MNLMEVAKYSEIETDGLEFGMKNYKTSCYIG